MLMWLTRARTDIFPPFIVKIQITADGSDKHQAHKQPIGSREQQEWSLTEVVGLQEIHLGLSG